jgi:hypothetical protein
MNPDPRGFGYVPYDQVDQLIQGTSEVERDRELTHLAFQDALKDPVRTLHLAVVKVAWFFSPFDGETYYLGSPYNPVTVSILLFSLIGLGCVWRGVPGSSNTEGFDRILIGGTLLILGWFMAMAAVFYGSPRFRMPVEPLLWLLAAMGAERVMNWPGRWREPFGVMLGLFLLVGYLGGDGLQMVLKNLIIGVGPLGK